MPTKISQLPPAIRKMFPRIEREVCALRDSWEVYHDLFMKNPQRTEFLNERFGLLLGLFQKLLQDQLFLAITRLTDKDTRGHSNLSLWALTQAVAPVATASARERRFGAKVEQALNKLCAVVKTVRKHRDKRIAHLDREVSLKSAKLPKVTFRKLRLALKKMEAFLNLFHLKFQGATMLFTVSPFEITGTAETTAYKAKAYDLLEKEGKIPHEEWKHRALS